MRKLKTSVPGVYAITCLANGKVYVGLSQHCTRRWGDHRNKLDRGIHRNYLLQADWTQFGGSAFTFEIVAYPADDRIETLQLLEREVLAKQVFAYNLMEPGDVGMLGASDETRARLSTIVSARWADPAYKERLRESHARRRADPEYRARQKAGTQAFFQSQEGRELRSKLTKAAWENPEVRAKQSANRKAAWEDPEHRAKQTAAREAAWKDPEKRDRRIAGMKRSWDNCTPEERQKRIDAAAARHRDPANRKAKSEQMKAEWAARKAGAAQTDEEPI